MAKADDNDTDDKELNAFLAGASRVNAVYRGADAPVPSAELDARVLETARRAVGPARARRPFGSPWALPLSAAAAALLGVGMFVLLDETPRIAAPTAVESAPAPTPDVPERAPAAPAGRGLGQQAPAAKSVTPEARTLDGAARGEARDQRREAIAPAEISGAVTRETLDRIVPGMTRAQVIERLGAPEEDAGRVMIYRLAVEGRAVVRVRIVMDADKVVRVEHGP